MSKYLNLDSNKFVVLRNGIENENFQQEFNIDDINFLKKMSSSTLLTRRFNSVTLTFKVTSLPNSSIAQSYSIRI